MQEMLKPCNKFCAFQHFLPLVIIITQAEVLQVFAGFIVHSLPTSSLSFPFSLTIAGFV